MTDVWQDFKEVKPEKRNLLAVIKLEANGKISNEQIVYINSQCDILKDGKVISFSKLDVTHFHVLPRSVITGLGLQRINKGERMFRIFVESWFNNSMATEVIGFPTKSEANFALVKLNALSNIRVTALYQ